MPFTIFQNSTTAYANELVDNFYWVADGDRLPRGAGSMTAIGSTYNLGSDINRWRNLYCNNLNIANSINASVFKKAFSLEDNGYIRIEVTGLNGDNNDYILQLDYEPSVSSSFGRLAMNQTSGTSLYYGKFIFWDNTIGSISIGQTSSAAFMDFLHTTTSPNRSNFYGYIHAKTGKQRILNGQEQRGSGNGVYKSVFAWNETSSTLTSFSITFTDQSDNKTRLDLWEAL